MLDVGVDDRFGGLSAGQRFQKHRVTQSPCSSAEWGQRYIGWWDRQPWAIWDKEKEKLIEGRS